MMGQVDTWPNGRMAEANTSPILCNTAWAGGQHKYSLSAGRQRNAHPRCRYICGRRKMSCLFCLATPFSQPNCRFTKVWTSLRWATYGVHKLTQIALPSSLVDGGTLVPHFILMGGNVPCEGEFFQPFDRRVVQGWVARSTRFELGSKR